MAGKDLGEGEAKALGGGEDSPNTEAEHVKLPPYGRHAVSSAENQSYSLTRLTHINIYGYGHKQEKQGLCVAR